MIAELPRDEIVDPVFARARAALVARGAASASTPTRCRSTPTSPATPTSRSASRCCSASGSRRTSTARTPPTSLQDFWRRWHMTLSRWLRDYLYIPLGGNRGGTRARTATSCSRCCSAGSGTARRGRSWSGAASTGVACRSSAGGDRGAAARPSAGRPEAGCAWHRRLVTFHVVCFGLDLLPRRLVRDGLRHVRAPVHGAGASRRRSSPGRSCCRSPSGSDRSICPPRVPRRSWRASRACRLSRRVRPRRRALLISTLGPAGVAPFIYFQF